MSTFGVIAIMLAGTFCALLLCFGIALVLYARHPDNNRDDNASFTWGDES